MPGNTIGSSSNVSFMQEQPNNINVLKTQPRTHFESENPLNPKDDKLPHSRKIAFNGYDDFNPGQSKVNRYTNSLRDLGKITVTVPPRSRVVVTLTMSDATTRTVAFENMSDVPCRTQDGGKPGDQNKNDLKGRLYISPNGVIGVAQKDPHVVRNQEEQKAHNELKQERKEMKQKQPDHWSYFRSYRNIAVLPQNQQSVLLTGKSDTGFSIYRPKAPQVEKVEFNTSSLDDESIASLKQKGIDPFDYTGLKPKSGDEDDKGMDSAASSTYSTPLPFPKIREIEEDEASEDFSRDREDIPPQDRVKDKEPETKQESVNTEQTIPSSSTTPDLDKYRQRPEF